MNPRLELKRLAENIPEPIGRLLVHVPYSFRLGKEYSRTVRRITEYTRLSDVQRKELIFNNVRRIVEFAFSNNDFYQEFYSSRGFTPSRLNEFDDITGIPVVTKEDLRAFSLGHRSNPERGMLRLNTGGTSGEPLEFYVDRHAFAREWAHMHNIWSLLGYEQTDLKLTFRGRNLGQRPLQYNPVHNEFIINTYLDFGIVVEAIQAIAQRRQVKFLHGYPSAVYRFAEYCSSRHRGLVRLLSDSLKGVLLGSEYPAPAYREIIEEVFGVPTLSWYGHSEMAILAFERSKYVYEPLHTYGYCEAIPDGKTDYRLIGTSYYNRVSPFIRYDTGDRVLPTNPSGVLDSFAISSGRVGEFITDAAGQAISLTAFIFGRHHPVFRSISFIQVSQDRPGHATLHFTVREGVDPCSINWSKGFDSSGVRMTLDFRMMKAPIRSPSGKVPLLLKAEAELGKQMATSGSA